jgi:hypothetical protein
VTSARRLIPALIAAAALSGCSSSRPTTPAAAPGVIAAPAPSILSTEPWTFQGIAGKVISTEHYRVFTTETDPILCGRIPIFMELALNQYTGAMGPLPSADGQLDLFLMAKRWQWTRLTQQLMGDQADTYLRIPRGGYAAGGRAILYNIGIRDTLAIAAHEGWHQFTQRTFREGLPVWLEEGIASYMEGYRNDPQQRDHPIFFGWANVERFDQLRAAAARGQIMPLEKLLGSSPQELLQTTTGGTLTYYAQVWALVHFLNEGEGGRYRQGLRGAVRDAAEGRLRRKIEERVGARLARQSAMSRVGPALALTYFTLDFGAMSDQYAAFIDRLVRTGSKDLIVQGRSPMSEP